MGRGGLLLVAVLGLAACAAGPSYTPGPKAVTTSAGLKLDPVTFADLPDWNQGRQFEALTAFRRSCRKLIALPADAPVGPDGFAGQTSDWLAACRSASTIGAGEDDSARLFFQHLFRPYRLSDAKNGDEGFLTGYYLPRVRGSREHRPGFDVPLYRRPPDLVTGDDGRLGRLADGSLQPYYTRAQIDAGALSGRGLELVWLASPIDAFFVSIQGSAEISLSEGGKLHLGVASSNGWSYTAIGRVLVERGALAKADVSMQSIRAWLEANPKAGQAVMAANPSYVFFRKIKPRAPEDGPDGAMGVALTAGRSLAVDRRFVPLGIPIWVAGQNPDRADDRTQRLLISQDTGGAITGPVRGDVFWGTGAAAAARAGIMREFGNDFLFLPRAPSIPVASAE